MKEKPIIFSGAMVWAILAGRKTMTRRIVKPQPKKAFPNICNCLECEKRRPEFRWYHHKGRRTPIMVKCPYGAIGDRLWVRETCLISPARDVVVRQGHPEWEQLKRYGYKVTPSIHMPRWASRITLEITGVRVERLRAITEKDAIAEGIPPSDVAGKVVPTPIGAMSCSTHVNRVAFQILWETINGAGSWEANPWVWVVEFKRVEPKEAR